MKKKECPECGNPMRVVLSCKECGGSFKVSAFPPKPECPLCGAILDGHYACDGCNKKYTRQALEMYGSKKTLTEEESIQNLMKIPGVGQLKAKALYSAGFHTLFQISSASVEDLAMVPKIGKTAAQKIKKELEKEDIKALEAKEIEMTLVDEEVECPICATILSVYDTQCYECGMDFHEKKDDATNAEDLKALAVYDRKLKSNPNDADILFAKAATLARMDRHQEAIASYSRVQEIDPDFDGLWNAMAETYTTLGEHDKAADAYKKSMEGALGDILAMPVAPQKEKAMSEEDKLLDMLLGLGDEVEDEEDISDLDAELGLTVLPVASAPPSVSAQDEQELEDMLDSLLVEVEDEEPEFEVATEQSFTCPLCGTSVPGDAPECPTCHAKFLEEEPEEMGEEYYEEDGEEGVEEEMEELDLLAELEGLVEEDAAEAAAQEEIVEIEVEPEPEIVETYEEGVVAGIGLRDEESAVEEVTSLEEPTSEEAAAQEAAADVRQPPMVINMFVGYSKKSWFLPMMAIMVIVLLIMAFMVAPAPAGAGDEPGIVVDGDISDWSRDLIYTDTMGDVSSPSGDIITCGVTSDSSHIYGFIRTQAAIFFSGDSGRDHMRWFIDADDSASTGYLINGLGADYMLVASGGSGNISSLSLFQFTGANQTEWGGWSAAAGDIDARSSGTTIEFSISKSSISITSTPRFTFSSETYGEVDLGPVIRLGTPGNL
ncbi:MAG: helix-hairpin-helix domain-containing protein [Candidatus Thermoplasmatota archaeon]|nr:helix-hairpin-helix domain-containing protein [Candidatus Thermoplasmatota archaeon]